eukprot:NODE_112_length_18534_cov_1.163656.p21 type:complete len:114 gc:universal NODE_112_length_18534_cov_1.163656:11303-11644(+)
MQIMTSAMNKKTIFIIETGLEVLASEEGLSVDSGVSKEDSWKIGIVSISLICEKSKDDSKDSRTADDSTSVSTSKYATDDGMTSNSTEFEFSKVCNSEESKRLTGSNLMVLVN